MLAHVLEAIRYNCVQPRLLNRVRLVVIWAELHALSQIGMLSKMFETLFDVLSPTIRNEYSQNNENVYQKDFGSTTVSWVRNCRIWCLTAPSFTLPFMPSFKHFLSTSLTSKCSYWWLLIACLVPKKTIKQIRSKKNKEGKTKTSKRVGLI